MAEWDVAATGAHVRKSYPIIVNAARRRSISPLGTLIRGMGGPIAVSERAVSDLVFRDLAPESATPRSAEGEEWDKRVREELGKLRPRRPAPRVVPAAEAAARATDVSPAQ
jgi:hypothetical protein